LDTIRLLAGLVLDREHALAGLGRELAAGARARGAAARVLGVVGGADEEFEAFLLELLSDFQVSIPEIGTIKAEEPPIVVLTSNRTREIHDALKRRCVYHWIDYPTPERESAIIQRKVPELEAGLADAVSEAMSRLRNVDLFKPPGVAESLDWAESLRLLQAGELSVHVIESTLGVVLKYKDDIDLVRSAGVESLVG
jgi:MoxR-like ATPase